MGMLNTRRRGMGRHRQIVHYFTPEDAAQNRCAFLVSLNGGESTAMGDPNWFITDYMNPLRYKNFVIFMVYHKDVCNIVYYNSNKEIIGWGQVPDNGDQNSYLPITYPKDTVYFRLCWGLSKSNTSIWGQGYIYEI